MDGSGDRVALLQFTAVSGTINRVDVQFEKSILRLILKLLQKVGIAFIVNDKSNSGKSF